ncbi:MAG: family 78 glycoside hydrolase catalytic domain [Bilifractor sp.]|jgi:alpha-L-rhamnosidase
MKVSDIRINGIRNPLGYSLENLRAMWILSGTEKEKVSSTAIEVSLRKDFSDLVYRKSGKNLSQTGERLLFDPLPRTRYYVRVSVTLEDGRTVRDDEEAWFETSKMEEPWSGKWLTTDSEDIHPVFIREIALQKPAASARLYISGLGLYEARINGAKVGDEVLTPYYNDYHTEEQYQTFDVTELLNGACGEKPSVLEVYLGNGWYKGKFGLGHTDKNFGSRFLLIAELHIRYEDGNEEVIGTDQTWRYRGSDIGLSDIYDGETLNRLLYENRENPLKDPIVAGEDLPEGRLAARHSLPVKEMLDMPVREVIHTPSGETVLDFGQNFAGYVTFRAAFPKGTEIILDFGEILQDGFFYNANYREARSRYVYISDGREEVVRPHFTFFGFRYCRVTGWPGEAAAEDFTGKAVFSDMKQTGEIETGHAGVNRLFLNALWGQRSNSVDLPTDCPQRDERLGWTGDAQVFAGTACYNMDAAAFYDKFIRDLREEQVKYDGILPGVIPVLDPKGPIFSSVWGDIAAFLPAVLYEHYGDRSALSSCYTMMKDWVDKITREDRKRGQQYLYNFGNQLGDWLALDGRTEQSMNGGTDEYYIGSNYYAMSVKKTADAAEALGRDEEAREYRELYGRICDAIVREYFTASGRLAVDTQTAYIVALYSGICPDRKRVVEGLKTRLYKDCFRLKGGFVGAPLMCRVMAENGMEEEAFYFLTQRDYPGWMHCIDLGATTIWERWNSVLDDGHLSGTMMNSLNHYAYGAVVEYLYRDVASLKPLEAGFRKVEFAPQMSRKLQYMKAECHSPYGTWKSFWEIQKDGSVHAEITVPYGCTARIRLPFYPDKEIGEVGMGTHGYTYFPTVNLRSRYTRNTLFRDMMQDPEAREVIRQESALLDYFLENGNEDFLYDSLNTVMGMSYMGFHQEEIEKLAEKLTALSD